MLARAEQGLAVEGDWLVADRQTAGRGRHGREWVSPGGNLYATTLVTLRDGDPVAPTLALVAGIAAFDVLCMPGLQLKWPNDLIVGSAKLGGILLERSGQAIVIGMGVNLASHPDMSDRPSTSLAALGVSLTRDVLVQRLIQSVAAWVAEWRSQRLPAVRDAWLARAHAIGTMLSAAVPDGTRVSGSFAGLTETCALRLALADGQVRVIDAGDVFLV